MIRNVILDIGGVLVRYDGLRYFRSFGYPEEMAKKLADATMGSTWWCEFDRGEFTNEEILSFMIADHPELEADIKKTLSHQLGVVTKKETAIPWIRHLHEEGAKVYYLSNFSKVCLSDCEDAMAFHHLCEGGVFSFEEQMIKPNPDIYKRILEKYDLDPKECVFCDDTYRNLPMAEHFGIRTVWYRNQEQAEQEIDDLLRKEV